MRVKVERVDKHHFKFSVRNLHGDIDVLLPVQSPIEAQVPNPKELALSALCGCTGTDVVDLLAKFKVNYQSLAIEARAELTEAHPKVFSKIDLRYDIESADGNSESVAEAVKRSTHQYRGMAYMLSRVCPIEYKVAINKTVIAEGKVEFS